MSRVPYVRARLRKISTIAVGAAVVAAGLLVPSAAYAVAAPQTQSDVLGGTSLSADGWTGPASDPSGGYDFNVNDGVLQASNYGANGVITQLESPTTQEAGEPGYTDAAFDTYHVAFTLDGNALGDDNYIAQPGVSLEMDADEGGNRAGGGLYFTVPADHSLEIDNFSTTDPFGDLWAGATTTIPFTGPVTIDYTVQFVAGGRDVVTVKANNATVLSTAAGTYEGYSFGVAAGQDATAPATAADADKVDQVLFRATHKDFNSSWTPNNTDPNVTPWATLPDAVPATTGGGFTFSDLTYGAESSAGPAFADTTATTVAANQIADYEDSTTYDSWHIGSNGDATDTSDYFDVLANGNVQLNDLSPNDSHAIQLLKGIPTADQPTDLYALVAQGLAWTLPTSNLASYQVALTGANVAGSHFTTLHSESQVESTGLNVARLSDSWVSTHAIGSIAANTAEPLGVLLAALEPGVTTDANYATDIAAADVHVLGFGVASEATAGQATTDVGPVYFDGVKYSFSAASAVTLHTPIITGTPAVGKQLKASAAVTPTAATASYQWYRNGVAIHGAKAKARIYTATGSDYRKKLSVKVTETYPGFITASAKSAKTAKVALGTITPTGTVAIVGTAQVGLKLSITKPTYSPTPSAFLYRWMRNGTPITGATSSTHTIVAADLGATITVSVVAKKSFYSHLSITSGATAAVIPGVLGVSAAPTVKGTLKSGQTLTAASGGWTADGVATTHVTKRYFWFISDGSATPDMADLLQVSTVNTLKLAYWAHGLKVSVYVTGSEQGYTSATTSLSAFSATVQ